MRPRRRGFTLIEMVAVVAIVAMMAGLAAISLRRHLPQPTMEELVERIADYDRVTRLWASRSGRPASLHITDRQLSQREPGDHYQASEMSRSALGIPRGFLIRDIWIAGEMTPRGIQTIEIGKEGRSRTYGLRLIGPREQEQWILVAGPTGQVTVLGNDFDARDIFKLLSQKRLDPP